MNSFCVIGTPIAHSRSPQLIGGFMEERGITGSYVRNEIKTEEELAKFVTELRNGCWDGCNVTMPWKTRMAELTDELSVISRLTHSVNTVKVVECNEEGKRFKLIGHSTDGEGMCNALMSTGLKLPESRLIVLGCGGAARAIVCRAVLCHAKEILIFCNEGHNKDLCKAITDAFSDTASNINCSPEKPGPLGAHEDSGFTLTSHITYYDWSETAVLLDFLSENNCRAVPTALLNCTPVGMKPNENACPIPQDLALPSCLTVADAVYEPLETKLILLAKNCGCKTVPGLRMLEEQGRASASFWFDR